MQHFKWLGSNDGRVFKANPPSIPLRRKRLLPPPYFSYPEELNNYEGDNMVFLETSGMQEIEPNEKGKFYKRICMFCKHEIEGQRRICDYCGRSQEGGI